MSDTSLSPAHIISEDNDLIVQEVFNEEKGTQADFGNKIDVIDGVDKQCRICGGEFSADCKALQDKWIGCDHPGCIYWIHAYCLLGKSSKITNAFVKKNSI